MATPTAQDVLMWALINRARLDPAGEAARDGIDLNEGLSAGTISAASKQPLAWNASLFAAADLHSAEMLSRGYFAHNDPVTLSTPTSRQIAAGYHGSIVGFENIGWSGSSAAINATQMINDQEKALFTDTTEAGRGHRLNILNNSLQEVGVGQEIGTFQGFNASMVTQDFGAAGGQLLTGIAYNDTAATGFYSVGEGQGNISVTTSGGSAATAAAGYFSEAIGTGTQNITFSGGDLASSVSVSASIAAGTNALIDLIGQSTIETSVSLNAGAGVTKIIGLGVGGLTLTGNNAGDTFVRGKGNNTITGGSGIDSVVYSGNRASFTITSNANGTVTVAGPDGTDTLKSIEKLQFNDQVVTLSGPTPPVDTAPTVTASNRTAAHGQSFAASSLFRAVDADGDAITKYAFKDTGAGGGHFVLNGVAQGVNQEIDVTAAQLSGLSYQSGSGADTLQVRAFDGTQWGNWSNSFTVTGRPDTAPTVTVSNRTAAHGQALAASSLFTAVDADGDAITKYAFWDTGAGGGHFVLNGVVQGVSREIDVTAAQLSQLSYQSGSGADTLWVAAYDGALWSNWSNPFTVTAPIDNGPTVTPTNSVIKSFANQSLAASSLFTYSDPFGSPATQYDFWDTGAGGGHFVLNGTTLGANQHNVISAAQLGQLLYHVGTGSDTIWVGANDGTVWGNWSNGITISDPPAVAAGETITLGSHYAGRVSFLSDTGTLKLEDSSSFAGTVAGLRGRDAIDFADIGFGTKSTLGYAGNADHSGGTLSVGDGTHMAQIGLLGSYMASTFAASSDGHGGTLISEAAQTSNQMPVVTHQHA